MKKSIIIVACISSTFIHGMEISEMSSFSTRLNKTTINIKTGCIFEANNKVSLIVINKHHHKKLVTFVADYYNNQPIFFYHHNKNIPPKTIYNTEKKPLIPQQFYYTMHIPENTDPTISEEKATEDIMEYIIFTLVKSIIKIDPNKEEKTIALTPLNPNSGFHKNHLALGTVKGILNFINESPCPYNYIELFVEHPDDVIDYASLFLDMQQDLMDKS